jgi:hypothetical protein
MRKRILQLKIKNFKKHKHCTLNNKALKEAKCAQTHASYLAKVERYKYKMLFTTTVKKLSKAYLFKTIIIIILNTYFILHHEKNQNKRVLDKLKFKNMGIYLTGRKEREMTHTSSSWIIAAVRQPAFEGPLRSLKR